MKIGDLVVCSHAALVREVQAAIEEPIAKALSVTKLAVQIANEKKEIAAETHLDNVQLRHALTILLADTQNLHHNCLDDDCPVKYARKVLKGNTKQ